MITYTRVLEIIQDANGPTIDEKCEVIRYFIRERKGIEVKMQDPRYSDYELAQMNIAYNKAKDWYMSVVNFTKEHSHDS